MSSSLGQALPPEIEPFRAKIEATMKPYVHLTAEINPNLNLFQSKFGGHPYLPKDVPYPTDPNGHPMFLLAQINFAETPTLSHSQNPVYCSSILDRQMIYMG